MVWPRRAGIAVEQVCTAGVPPAWQSAERALWCRYAPLVSRQHGKAPRVAWTAFHNVQLAPPGLPHVRSSRGFVVERSQSEGAPAGPRHVPSELHSFCQPHPERCSLPPSPLTHLGYTAAVTAESLTHIDLHEAMHKIDTREFPCTGAAGKSMLSAAEPKSRLMLSQGWRRYMDRPREASMGTHRASAKSRPPRGPPRQQPRAWAGGSEA